MPRRSNFDSIWTEQQQAAALDDGWELVFVVDEGKPVSTAYIDVFDAGPKFPSKRAAANHVVNQARGGNKLHISALSVCQASRMQGAAKGKR